MDKQVSTNSNTVELFLSNLSQPEGSENCLKGIRFVVSGYFFNFTKQDIENIILHFGGLVCSELDYKTNFLVVGKEADVSLLSESFLHKALLLTKKGFFKILYGRITRIPDPFEKDIFKIGMFPPKNSPLYNKHVPAKLSGKVFALTGFFSVLCRVRLLHLIRYHKGHYTRSLDSTTTYLLAGNSGNQTRINEANARSIPILTEEMFLKLLLSDKEYADLLVQNRQTRIYYCKIWRDIQAEKIKGDAAKAASAFISYDLLVGVSLDLDSA